MQSDWMTFPALDQIPGFENRFLLRKSGIDVDGERHEVVARLKPWHDSHLESMGLTPMDLRLSEQIHGAKVAVVDHSSSTEPEPGADGLISNATNVALGIYVADCCAIYLIDPVSGAFGLLHSGRKGSELGIASVALKRMQAEFGSRPENMHVQLSPCIRPPAFEIDFAAIIRQDCLNAGVLPGNLFDSGICTASDLTRFYSYRIEKGRTGRMLAILMKK